MYRFLGSTDISMYGLVGVLGFVAILVYNFCCFRNKQKLLSNASLFFINSVSEKNKQSLFARTAFWTAAEIIIISLLQIMPSGFFNKKLGNILDTGANYFGLLYFIPFVLFLLFFIISVNPFRQMDLITPAYPLALIFTKLACFCDGCCEGFECSWGLMNYHYETGPVREFPSQLLEAGLALIIFIFLMWYRKKAKEGTLFPIYVILYSATRFFSEFTRGEPNVFGILKTYHILCIIGVVIGIIELLVVLKFSDRISPLFNLYLSDNKKDKNKTKKKTKKNKKKASAK